MPAAPYRRPTLEPGNNVHVVPGPGAGSGPAGTVRACAICSRGLMVRHGAGRHVLDERAAIEDIEELVSAADPQQRQALIDGPAGNGQVQCVLREVHVVALGALLLAVKSRVQVAPAGEYDAVEPLERFGQPAVAGVRGKQYRLPAAVADQVHDEIEQLIGFPHPRVGVQGAAEPDRNSDPGAAGRGRGGVRMIHSATA